MFLVMSSEKGCGEHDSERDLDWFSHESPLETTSQASGQLECTNWNVRTPHHFSACDKWAGAAFMINVTKCPVNTTSRVDPCCNPLSFHSPEFKRCKQAVHVEIKHSWFLDMSELWNLAAIHHCSWNQKGYCLCTNCIPMRTVKLQHFTCKFSYKSFYQFFIVRCEFRFMYHFITQFEG